MDISTLIKMLSIFQIFFLKSLFLYIFLPYAYNAIIAVFKRNLASYFGSPSGYVFICAFLLASGLAAFWPQEFFDSNLANLDQLNKFLPHILL